MGGKRLDGEGVCIGIIETGGGFTREGINRCFDELEVSKDLRPEVSAVSIRNTHNNPGKDPLADAEVALDIGVAGAIAPGAKIVVYFCDGTTSGSIEAVKHAIHDRENNPSVISISWGAPEGKSRHNQYMDSINEAFEEASLLGKTICCSSGDNGSSDLRPEHGKVNDGLAHVHFPASSPYVLACGGTELNELGSEVVWNNKEGASGGGVSDYFLRPPYQRRVKIPASVNNSRFIGRGVPDVAGLASPGYKIPLQSQVEPRGGTSAVAPMWAGLIALINQGISKPVGFLNPLLYASLAPTGFLNDVTKGNNSVKRATEKGITRVKGYNATKGWDACTGFGTPDGTKLLRKLSPLTSIRGE